MVVTQAHTWAVYATAFLLQEVVVSNISQGSYDILTDNTNCGSLSADRLVLKNKKPASKLKKLAPTDIRSKSP